MSRRQFIWISAGAASAAALGAGGVGTALAAKGGGGGGGGGGKGGKGGATRFPLYVPPVIHPDGATLTAGVFDVDVSNGGGAWTPAWAFNGSLPGPTLEVRSGDHVSLVFVNNLGEDSIVHWHGMEVPEIADGHPIHAVGPEGTYHYEFAVRQRATMNWYHPHPHGRTAPQVAMGLAGAFIIRDDVEDSLGLPTGRYEIPLIIRDTDFDRDGQLIYKPRSSGYEGKVPLVNGTRDPYVDVDAGVYRLRVLNGANGRIFRFAFADGRPMLIIGNDGGLLPAAAAVTEIELGNGERLDLLVDFGDLGREATAMLVDLNSGWQLVEFRGTGAPGVAPSLEAGSVLCAIETLSDPVVTRRFSFDGMGRINGQEYDMHRIDFAVPMGQVEQWVFSTGGNAPHPIHHHGTYFQVVSRTGGRGRVFPWERGWKDTVLLQDGETVEVLNRFDFGDHNRAFVDNVYLMHCHKLEHEDAGMMSNFRIYDADAPGDPLRPMTA